jgi:hypothetical protein
MLLCVFLVMQAVVFVFACSGIHAVRKSPDTGSKSKRIALDADATSGSWPNQNGGCLLTVLLFSIWPQGDAREAILSKKIS